MGLVESPVVLFYRCRHAAPLKPHTRLARPKARLTKAQRRIVEALRVNAALLAGDEADQARLLGQAERARVPKEAIADALGTVRATVYNRLRKLREPSGS